MSLLFDFFDSLRSFLNAGGIVLWIILFVSFCLWCLIIERLLFFKFEYPTLKEKWVNQWNKRSDKSSQYALTIRKAIISEAKITMSRFLAIIKMLIGLCPLFGLLGTVTGMIHVFDVMAVTGTGNARAMASGISQATIPTMAGMVVAIAGLYFNKLIEEWVDDEIHLLTDLLKYH